MWCQYNTSDHADPKLRDRIHYLSATFMSPGRHDKIEIERIKEVLMMKILLKILVTPFALALSLLAALLVFLFDICAVLLTIASVILAVLGVALFFTPTPIGGIVFLFLAFLLSPYGLQAAAGSLLWALDGGKSALYRFLAS